jgi:hypothetical protein
MTRTNDPYGEQDYGAWEDPFVHALLTNCTGCPMCFTWGSKSPAEINADRVGLVMRHRAFVAAEPTARELAQEDRDYWNAAYE